MYLIPGPNNRHPFIGMKAVQYFKHYRPVREVTQSAVRRKSQTHNWTAVLGGWYTVIMIVEEEMDDTYSRVDDTSMSPIRFSGVKCWYIACFCLVVVDLKRYNIHMFIPLSNFRNHTNTTPLTLCIHPFNHIWYLFIDDIQCILWRVNNRILPFC